MKNYSYEIKYNNNGEQTSEFEYSKFSALYNYMNKLIDANQNISSLKILRNGTDITPQVNKFLCR